MSPRRLTPMPHPDIANDSIKLDNAADRIVRNARFRRTTMLVVTLAAIAGWLVALWLWGAS